MLEEYLMDVASTRHLYAPDLATPRFKMARRQIGLFLIICLSLGWQADFRLSPVLAAGSDAEPPFPQIAGYGGGRMKIVSESVDERLGTQTNEEYHDLYDMSYKSAYYTSSPVVSNGQSAVSISAANNYHIRFINDRENLAYFYRPFQCKVTKLTDLPQTLYDEQQNWTFDFKTKLRSRERRYFGVYGLYMYANSVARRFARAQIVYSASKDIYRESLLWIVRHEEYKLDIKFFFIDHDDKKSDKAGATHATNRRGPSLEMIQIEMDDAQSANNKRLIRTINILSLEYALAEEVYTELFEPPVGFGCFSSLVEEGEDMEIIESRRRDANKWLNWAQHSLHAELEVTATKYQPVQSQAPGVTKEERISETYNVEVAQSKVQGLLEQDFIELIRLRNTGSDKKVVLNHMLRVSYSIDMRTGSCEMSHMSSAGSKAGEDAAQPESKSEAERTDELYELAALKFKSNGLALDIGVRMFKDPADLHFIKKTVGSAKQPELHYYEGSSTEALKNLEDPAAHGGVVRKVRTIFVYTKSGDKLELHSLTIWVLNEQLTHILESYLINLIDARPLNSGWPDEAKMFDVSEECYLENERMVQNHDYAWLQLTYPAQSQVLNVFASNEFEVKREFYQRAFTDFTRVPRLEVLFEEDSFILRTLMLDLPATELIYDKFKGQALVPATARGDLSYLAPDLQHCGRYCRMHRCTVMTFCSTSSSCILSSRQLAKPKKEDQARSDDVLIIADNAACETYKIPPIVERNQLLKQHSLQAIISKYKHQNYGIATLPNMPDEIALARSETGLSTRDYMTAIQDYQTALEKSLEADDRLPELAIPAVIGEHFFVFLPNKFELENDPLREFNIYENFEDGAEDEEDNDGGQQSLPRFHQGLPGARYNLAAQEASEQTRNEVAFRSFSGLTYDQCAMACADSRCGSFSFCNHQGGECILSNINNTGRARMLGVVQEDSQCFIAQRDFLRNFDKFQSIFRPQVYTKTSDAGDASECALNCVSETNFKCLSFEFCAKSLTPNALPRMGQCYYQIERHLPGSEQLLIEGEAKRRATVKPKDGSDSRCDHYSRSYLADFVRLENRKLVEPLMDQLKTSAFNGLSVFSCAEKCATELIDCTGFQFCHVQDETSAQQTRQCTTIESKITPKLLKTLDQSAEGDTETVVDEKAGGRLLKAGKYLQFDEHCQVFTLSKDTAEAQLRDLAFGSLIKTTAQKEAEQRAKDESAAADSGSGLTLFSGLFLYLSVALVSAAIGFGFMMIKDNNVYIQQRLDRLRILMGV